MNLARPWDYNFSYQSCMKRLLNTNATFADKVKQDAYAMLQDISKSFGQTFNFHKCLKISCICNIENKILQKKMIFDAPFLIWSPIICLASLTPLEIPA